MTRKGNISRAKNGYSLFWMMITPVPGSCGITLCVTPTSYSKINRKQAVRTSSNAFIGGSCDSRAKLSYLGSVNLTMTCVYTAMSRVLGGRFVFVFFLRFLLRHRSNWRAVVFAWLPVWLLRTKPSASSAHVWSICWNHHRESGTTNFASMPRVLVLRLFLSLFRLS